LSTQQQCLHLTHQNLSASAKAARNKSNAPDVDVSTEDYLTCETKDFVEIAIKADVFYQIDDAEKVLLIVGKGNVSSLVRETAIACLNSIIRSTSLAEVAQSKEVNAKSQKKEGQQFFDKVHDEFISKLHDSFNEHFGINISNIRIESFKLLNSDLSLNISKQALLTAQTESQLANLAGQTEIATAQQKRDAEVAKIRAEGDATKVRTEVDAKNRATMETAKAEADSTLIKARAEAQALEFRAEAEAKAIALKAEAEAKRSEMIAKTPIGSQLAMFQVYADMIKSSTAGVQKVVYMPVDNANNPLNFMSTAGNGLLQSINPLALPAPEKGRK